MKICLNILQAIEFMSFPPFLRVSRAPDSHQHVSEKAPGKWLVQSAPREAETENNWNCAALPQQAARARVLHFTLPRGRGGKASPLMPACPVLTLAHKCTLQHTHPHIRTHHLQLCVVYTHVHTHTNRIFIFILYCFVIYVTIYINTVCLWLQKQSVKNHAKMGKSYISMLQLLIEWLKFFSDLSLISDHALWKKKNLLLFLDCSTRVSTLGLFENVKGFLSKATWISSWSGNRDLSWIHICISGFILTKLIFLFFLLPSSWVCMHIKVKHY